MALCSDLYWNMALCSLRLRLGMALSVATLILARALRQCRWQVMFVLVARSFVGLSMAKATLTSYCRSRR